MKHVIEQIIREIAHIRGCQFASLTYLSKGDKSLARYTVNLGFSYDNLVKKSVEELSVLMLGVKPGTLEHTGAEELMDSLNDTLIAHTRGEQNDRYTKKDQYLPIVNGLCVNSKDMTLQLFGLLQSKVILVEGEYRHVNSAPLTIAKNKIRKQLSVSKFREFSLDAGNVSGVSINGTTIQMVHPKWGI